MIVDVELEISACELNLRKLNTKKEEEMVSHDLVRLEVRRLRDILRNKVEEVLRLENQSEELSNQMSARKAEIRIHTEVKVAQLRASVDERHKLALELGQRKHQERIYLEPAKTDRSTCRGCWLTPIGKDVL